MAPMDSHSKGRNVVGWAAGVLVCGLATAAWAQDLTVSAKVDKTTVGLGEPITLVVTIGGDLTGLEAKPLELPEGFAVGARSQSTNFSIRSGIMERTMSLMYVLVPQRAGTFQLGPFTVVHQKKEFKTEPIEITVSKPALPPSLQQPQGGRFTL